MHVDNAIGFVPTNPTAYYSVVCCTVRKIIKERVIINVLLCRCISTKMCFSFKLNVFHSIASIPTYKLDFGVT